MIWEVLFVGFGLAFGFGAAFIMARKIKNVPTPSQSTDLNIADLIAKVAIAVSKEVGKEIKEALKDLPAGSVVYHREKENGDEEIQIDERIIPISVSTKAIETNLEAMATTETTVDKGLGNAKSKLASMLKKKKK